ncbi:MAG: hypothetical protein HOF44_10380 [Pelagibacterales bacterium]|jgi:hypothetical protein|nr:hypothetical protein [Pelagibacterales bacterium]
MSNSIKKYHEMKQDIVYKESLYLCSEIEKALERIISYDDGMLDDKLFTQIKKPAIKLLKEWHL